MSPSRTKTKFSPFGEIPGWVSRPDANVSCVNSVGGEESELARPRRYAAPIATAAISAAIPMKAVRDLEDGAASLGVVATTLWLLPLTASSAKARSRAD